MYVYWKNSNAVFYYKILLLLRLFLDVVGKIPNRTSMLYFLVDKNRKQLWEYTKCLDGKAGGHCTQLSLIIYK